MVSISTAKKKCDGVSNTEISQWKLEIDSVFSPCKAWVFTRPFPDRDISHAREGSSAPFIPAVLCSRTVGEPGRGKLPGFILLPFWAKPVDMSRPEQATQLSDKWVRLCSTSARLCLGENRGRPGSSRLFLKSLLGWTWMALSATFAE